MFMFVSGPDGSDSDMPIHCWNWIQYALESVFETHQRECIVWLTNIGDLKLDREWNVIEL